VERTAERDDYERLGVGSAVDGVELPGLGAVGGDP
jgi:hypothetical protein